LWLLAALAPCALLACDAGSRPALPSPADRLAGHNAATRARFAAAEAALRRDPRSSAALEHLARLYHAHQYHAEAAELYRRLGHLEPRTFRVAYLEALAEEARGRIEPAERAWRRAVALDPRHAEAWARLSAAQAWLGRDDDGRASAAAAVAADPLDPHAALAWSRVLAAGGDWAGSARALEPMLARHPRFAEGRRQLARAWAMLGDEERARREAEQGEFGDAADSPLLAEVFALALPAILAGDPARGRSIAAERCVRCHTLERMLLRPPQDLPGWASTVRRMQRLAGKALLTDDEAADVAAWLAAAGTAADRRRPAAH
jgi:tetratricopeptide (TPR) repeat protein